MLLATVKGDVHDIGKNLVDIILSNNGYNVRNLGIKVTPEELIRASREHGGPDAIGLSGLLVKSAQQMVVTARDLRAAGVHVPLLVGGAALSANFTRKRIAPSYGQLTCYARDAMRGLALLDQIMDPNSRSALEAEHAPIADEPREVSVGEAGATKRSSRARGDILAQQCPYGNRQCIDVPQLREIWRYVNPKMLFSRHLGFQGDFERALAERDGEKRWHCEWRWMRSRARAETFMKVRAVWRFVEAEGRGNAIRLYEPAAGAFLHEFEFPRQRRADGTQPGGLRGCVQRTSRLARFDVRLGWRGDSGASRGLQARREVLEVPCDPSAGDRNG